MLVETSFDFPLKRTAILRQIAEELKSKLPEWEQILTTSPSELSDVEQSILGYSRQIARYLTAAVLTAPNVTEAVEREAQQITQEQNAQFKKAYDSESLRVDFLCGLRVAITTPYLARRDNAAPPGASKKTGEGRGEEGAGLYPELAALGISKGASPALASETCRQAVLLPSYEMATLELGRRGVELTQDRLHTILFAVGLAALGARQEDLQRWKNGELTPAETLKDKKVAVCFDGGKARIRISKKGRKRRSGRRGYYTPWREPRLLVIYVLDKRGRIDRSETVVLDGTFQKDADHLMELAAYHLYRLGAQYAKKVIFLGDGADWIWNRVPTVAERAGLQEGQWVAAVDIYHVMEHVHPALNAVWGANTKRVKKERKRVKKLLLAGKVDKVLRFLAGLAPKRTHEDANPVQGCIYYIQERRALMDYGRLRAAGLPVGSGAIESAIRRVINLRIKAPGTFWCEDTAEAVLYMRAQLLANNWQAMFEQILQRARYTRQKQYKWTPTPMSVKEIENPKVVLLQQVDRKAG